MPRGTGTGMLGELIRDFPGLSIQPALEGFRHRRPRLVVSAPADHLHQDRDQSQALLGQPVAILGAVIGITVLGHDPAVLEALEAIGEDVGGDPLAGLEEVAIGAVIGEDEIADDEQRPPVTEQIQGEDHRASGAMFR